MRLTMQVYGKLWQKCYFMSSQRCLAEKLLSILLITNSASKFHNSRDNNYSVYKTMSLVFKQHPDKVFISTLFWVKPFNLLLCKSGVDNNYPLLCKSTVACRVKK